MIFTAIIQSSSASVGILQTLASSGLISLSNAVYVLFGQNIGTCITAVLASIGTSRSAKRTTIIHLMFNIIGTIIFTAICILTPLTSLIEWLTPDKVSAQIANMHTLFNIATTLLLIPFGNFMALAAEKILPEKAEEKAEGMHLQFLRPVEMKGENHIGLSAILRNDIKKELGRMLAMTKENVNESFNAIRSRSTQLLASIEEREKYIDYLNKEISKYISKILVNENNAKDTKYISALFKVCGNLERISDHAVNLGEYAQTMEEQGIVLSDAEMDEIREMQSTSMEALEALETIASTSKKDIRQIKALEQKIDDMTEKYRGHSLERMQKNISSAEGCVIFSEMLTDFERIGDHILNIGQEMGRGKVSA